MKKKIIATLLIAVTVMAQSLTAFAAPERVADGGYLDPDWYLSAYPELTTPEYTSKYPELAKALEKENPADKAYWLYQYHKKYGKDEGRVRVDNGMTTPAGNPGTSRAQYDTYIDGFTLTSEAAIAALGATIIEKMPETEVTPGVFRRVVEEWQTDNYCTRKYLIDIIKNTNVPTPATLAEDVIIAPGCGYPALENVKALHGQAFPKALCDQMQALSTSKENMGCQAYAVLMQNIVYGRNTDITAADWEKDSQSWILKRADWVKSTEIKSAGSAIGFPGSTYDLDTLPEVQKYDIIKYITSGNTEHWAFVLYVDKANNRVLTTEGGGRSDFIAATGSSNRTGEWVSISDIDAIQRPSNAITVNKFVIE